jgi:hypothetical protein
MKPEFDAVIRACVAVQVATYELHEEDVATNRALPDLETCVKELGLRVKALKKAIT